MGGTSHLSPSSRIEELDDLRLRQKGEGGKLHGPIMNRDKEGSTTRWLSRRPMVSLGRGI